MYKHSIKTQTIPLQLCAGPQKQLKASEPLQLLIFFVISKRRNGKVSRMSLGS